jgi:hypothetical protein
MNPKQFACTNCYDVKKACVKADGKGECQRCVVNGVTCKPRTSKSCTQRKRKQCHTKQTEPTKRKRRTNLQEPPEELETSYCTQAIQSSPEELETSSDNVLCCTEAIQSSPEELETSSNVPSDISESVQENIFDVDLSYYSDTEEKENESVQENIFDVDLSYYSDIEDDDNKVDTMMETEFIAC